MKYPKYPAYKDSGVEWIGKIPEGWKIKDTKRLFKVVNGSTPSTSILDYWDGDIIWITPEDLSKSNKYVINSERKITSEGYKSCGTTLVPPNSLILSTRAPIGYAALTSSECCTNQGCRSLVPYDGTYSDYYYYFMISCKEILNTMGNGATFKELSKSNLESLGLLVPSLAEQKQISFFLDSTLEKIDNGLANLQKMIELLKEKRQAIITHAVTKGLDPNVPMRDSGVEWIGEIPSSWNVVQTKWLMSCNDEVIPENSPSSFELTYVEISDVDFTRGITNRELMRFEDAPSRARRKVRDGDIIISTVRTYLKAIAEIKAPDNNLVVSTGFAVLRPRKVLQSFAKYALSASYFIEKVISESFGVSYPAITADRLVSIKLAVPDIKTQEKIADLLDKQTMNIDSLVKKQEEMIDLLREHRFSLISSAVTGKIEVRNLKINEISESNKYHG